MDSATLNTLINAIAPILTLLISGWLAFKMAELKANQERATLERAAQKEQIKEVHTAVNSERSTMIAKLDAMHEKISLLETAAGVRASEDAAIVADHAAHSASGPAKVEVVNVKPVPVVPTKPID